MRKHIPNTLSVINLLLGFAAIVLVMHTQHALLAVALIALGCIIDAFDGRLARKLNAVSVLGKHLDSFADFVTFCLAPALLLLQDFSIFVAIAAGAYVAAGAFRLARYNIVELRHQYIGLPASAACVLLLAYHLLHTLWLNIHPATTAVLLVVLAVLMACGIKTSKRFGLRLLMHAVDKLDRNNALPDSRRAIWSILDNPDGVWYQYITSFWCDINGPQRRKFFFNFIVNACVKGRPRQAKAKQQHGCNIPWAVLMDPTSACNLKCTGCWAAKYGNKLNLSFDEMDSIVRQGKQLGTYLYIFSGGEPLLRKEDILRLCKTHRDVIFLAFTNGTLIDEAFAKQMRRVRNFVPAISIEGSAEATDARRGAGTHEKVLQAMRILKRHKLLFGASVCYTSQNTDEVGSDNFFDELIAQGSKFAWYFTYMPVGNDAPTALIASAEQRTHMYHQVRNWRTNKPMFVLDFWNDGEYVKGCIAGGRYYLHINANGDVEPCAFIHYSDSNIREKTLLEALKSPLFMAYHDNQPFNENHLRPCPLLDNDGKLADLVHATGAKSTDLGSPENVNDLCAKCSKACENWATTADKLWETPAASKSLRCALSETHQEWKKV